MVDVLSALQLLAGLPWSAPRRQEDCDSCLWHTHKEGQGLLLQKNIPWDLALSLWQSNDGVLPPPSGGGKTCLSFHHHSRSLLKLPADPVLEKLISPFTLVIFFWNFLIL